MLSLSDKVKEESMPVCECGDNLKAIFYCGKGCNQNSTYYCMACYKNHRHEIMMIADETSENYNICLNAK